MFILKYLNIYLVQNKGVAAACLTAIFLAERGEIDICIYSNSSLPHGKTHSKSKKEEDIKSAPRCQKLQNHFSKTPHQTKTKPNPQNLEYPLSLMFLSSSMLALHFSLHCIFHLGKSPYILTILN